jgi:lipopolysaccharide heptosyltransferase I
MSQHPAPSRFLIVRLGALGDVVHAMPVAAALRRAFPDARIDWLVSAKHAEILGLLTVVDKVLAVRDRRDAGKGATIGAAIAQMRTTGYDCALDLQGLVKSALLARASGSERIIGFGKGYVREPLARYCYTETYDPGGNGAFDRRSTSHVMQLNLGMLRTLGIDAESPEFPLAAADSEVLREVLKQTGGRYALLNPGAAWPNKRWPPERFAAVAASIRERHGLTSIVLWGPGEGDLAEQVVAGSRQSAILSPPTSIVDLVALARGAQLMVSGDTGPTHIAAAVGTPLVGIYGPTRPERNGPWRAGDVTVSRAGNCECHHLRRCRRETMCLLEIGVDEIAAAVDRRLASVGGARA